MTTHIVIANINADTPFRALLQLLLLPLFRHLGNTQKPTGFLGVTVKPVEKPSKNPAANLIQFQFVLSIGESK